MLRHMEERDYPYAEFGRALSVQMGSVSRAVLAQQVTELSGESASESSVSLWLSGKNEPSRAKVFAIECALGLPGGTLSRHLGYLPADAKSARSVLDAIDADSDITEDAKAMLRAAYRTAARKK